jgi:hypothetical protein
MFVRVSGSDPNADWGEKTDVLVYEEVLLAFIWI